MFFSSLVLQFYSCLNVFVPDNQMPITCVLWLYCLCMYKVEFCYATVPHLFPSKCSSAIWSCSFYSCLNVFVLCVEVPVTYLVIVLSLYVQRILPCAQSDLDFGLHTTKYYETYTAKLELRTEPYVTFVFSYRPVCSLRYVLCHVLIVSASQRQILY